MVVFLGVRVYQRREVREERRRIIRWSAWSGGLAVFLWIPPVIDQLVHDPGNLRVIFDYFKAPPESPIGVGSGLKFFLANVGPGKLVVGLSNDFSASGSVIPGVLMLLAWAGAAFVAWRMRHQLLLRLNAVIAVALVLGLISASRIFGVVWFYLLLWGWGICALMLVAVGWTVAAVASRLLDPPTWSRRRAPGAAALIATTVAILGVFVAEAATVEVPTPRLSRSLAGVVPGTVRALEKRHGRGEPYLVTWLPDPSSIGNVGYGMLNELERAGFDVKTEAGNGQQAGQRSIDCSSVPMRRSRCTSPSVPRSRCGERCRGSRKSRTTTCERPPTRGVQAHTAEAHQPALAGRTGRQRSGRRREPVRARIEPRRGRCL